MKVFAFVVFIVFSIVAILIHTEVDATTHANKSPVFVPGLIRGE